MKTIKLTQDQETVVDDEDFEFLSQFTWHAAASTVHDLIYARTRVGDKHKNLLRSKGLTFRFRQYIAIHDLVVVKPTGYIVDHIDGDTLNNQKCNLRACTHRQNMRNSRKRKTGTSPYKGVIVYESMFSNVPVKYIAKIQSTYLGHYKTIDEAVKAYDKAALERFGEFACTNFPKEEYAIHSIHS